MMADVYWWHILKLKVQTRHAHIRFDVEMSSDDQMRITRASNKKQQPSVAIFAYELEMMLVAAEALDKTGLLVCALKALDESEFSQHLASASSE